MDNRRLILLLAFFTLIGFPLIGYLIHYLFGGENIDIIIKGNWNVFLQILVGFPIGWISALLAKGIINQKFMIPVRLKYGNLIGELGLKQFDAIFISICAGVGEELLFRGALQPLWGVWITAIVFVAMHGYLNPFDWRISIYGTFLTVVIIGLGFMTIYWGIWSAAAAHTAIDIVLLRFLIQTPLIPSNEND